MNVSKLTRNDDAAIKHHIKLCEAFLAGKTIQIGGAFLGGEWDYKSGTADNPKWEDVSAIYLDLYKDNPIAYLYRVKP